MKAAIKIDPLNSRAPYKTSLPRRSIRYSRDHYQNQTVNRKIFTLFLYFFLTLSTGCKVTAVPSSDCYSGIYKLLTSKTTLSLLLSTEFLLNGALLKVSSRKTKSPFCFRFSLKFLLCSLPIL